MSKHIAPDITPLVEWLKATFPDNDIFYYPIAELATLRRTDKVKIETGRGYGVRDNNAPLSEWQVFETLTEANIWFEFFSDGREYLSEAA